MLAHLKRRTTKAAEHPYMSNLCWTLWGLDYILDSNVLKCAYWLWSLKLWTFIVAIWRWWRRWVSHHETRPEMNLFTLEMCNWLCAPALSRATQPLMMTTMTSVMMSMESLMMTILFAVQWIGYLYRHAVGDSSICPALPEVKGSKAERSFLKLWSMFQR